MASFDKLLARKLQDPDIRAAYDDSVRRRGLIKELVDARGAAGLTQLQVAQRMGVSQSTVSEFESGEADPRMGTVQRYARAVGCRLDHWVTTPGGNRVVAASAQPKPWREVRSEASTSGRSDRADFALAR